MKLNRSKFLIVSFPDMRIAWVFSAVPDLETVKFKVLSTRDQYEIREIEVYILASVCFD